MEMKAVVQYRGEKAHYEITTEEDGLYAARLLKYEGKNSETPPQSVLLVKSFRHWTGSYNEPYLVEELGKVIEDRNREGNPASR